MGENWVVDKAREDTLVRSTEEENLRLGVKSKKGRITM